MGLKNKRGWLRIVEAFIAVFIIISVALFVINKGYIERRDISEKIYSAEVQLLQEIIDKFGKEELYFNNVYFGTYGLDENEIGDFIYGGGDYEYRRVPVYLDCGIRLCKIENPICKYIFNEPLDEKSDLRNIDIYVQTLPILYDEPGKMDSLLSIECWLN